jgi:hypothetical protein
MLHGTTNNTANEQQDPIFALPKELRAMIFALMPYALQLKLRRIAKYWKAAIEGSAPLPLLNMNVILNALSYTSYKNANFDDIHIEALKDNDATLHLSPTSVNSLVMKFRSKSGFVTDDGIFQYYPPAPDTTILVSKVFLLALKRSNLHEQYDSFTYREQRHNFIINYTKLPNYSNYPRWKFLSHQTPASLERLKESLGRYHDAGYKALILEVDSALLARRADIGNSTHTPCKIPLTN